MHTRLDEAKNARVSVFGGGIDDDGPTVLGSATGSVALVMPCIVMLTKAPARS